jgi:hypothetical protein
MKFTITTTIAILLTLSSASAWQHPVGRDVREEDYNLYRRHSQEMIQRTGGGYQPPAEDFHYLAKRQEDAANNATEIEYSDPECQDEEDTPGQNLAANATVSATPVPLPSPTDATVPVTNVTSPIAGNVTEPINPANNATSPVPSDDGAVDGEDEDCEDEEEGDSASPSVSASAGIAKPSGTAAIAEPADDHDEEIDCEEDDEDDDAEDTEDTDGTSSAAPVAQPSPSPKPAGGNVLAGQNGATGAVSSSAPAASANAGQGSSQPASGASDDDESCGGVSRLYDVCGPS